MDPQHPIQSSPVGIMIRGVPPNQTAVTMGLRAAAAGISLGVIAAAAYNLTVYRNYVSETGYVGPAGYLIFMASYTFVAIVAVFIAQITIPYNFHRLGVLIAFGVSCVLWLTAWTWAASVSSRFFQTVCLFLRTGEKECLEPTDADKRFGTSLAVGAALGGLTWILMIAITVSFYRKCTRDPHAVDVELSESPEIKHPSNSREPSHGPVYT